MLFSHTPKLRSDLLASAVDGRPGCDRHSVTVLTVSRIFRRAVTFLLQFGGYLLRKQNDAVLPGRAISASLNFISKDEGVFREIGYSVGPQSVLRDCVDTKYH